MSKKNRGMGFNGATQEPELELVEIAESEVTEQIADVVVVDSEESVDVVVVDSEEPVVVVASEEPVVVTVTEDLHALRSATGISTFVQVICSELNDYVKYMSPGYPTTPSIIQQQQVSLSRVYDKLLNENEVVKFKDGMAELAAHIRANPVTFSAKYVNRGMSEVALSSEKRKQFETLNFLLPGILGENGVRFYNQYSANALLAWNNEQVRQRLASWIKRELNLD